MICVLPAFLAVTKPLLTLAIVDDLVIQVTLRLLSGIVVASN